MATGVPDTAAETAGRDLGERIKNTIGVTVATRAIEGSAGKMRQVVDRRAG